MWLLSTALQLVRNHVGSTQRALRFEDVFQETAPVVHRALRRLGVRESDVLDVAQEVFIVIHRKLGDFEGRSSIRTWVYGICIRVAADYRKRAHIRREVADDKAGHDRATETTLEDETDRQRSLLWLDSLLAELDHKKREVFVLYEVEELTLAEIAEITETPLQTVYSRLGAARQFVEQRAREKGALA